MMNFELTTEQKLGIVKVVDYLMKDNTNFLVGNFDAKNINPHFMEGLRTAMEFFCCLSCDLDLFEKYTGLFSENFEKSLEKAEKRG